MDEFEVLKGQALNILLNKSGLHLFNGRVLFADGEMQEDFICMKKHLGALSHGEQLLVQVANEIWTGNYKVKIGDLCYHLGEETIALVVSLYIALGRGHRALMAWVEEVNQ